MHLWRIASTARQLGAIRLLATRTSTSDLSQTGFSTLVRLFTHIFGICVARRLSIICHYLEQELSSIIATGQIGWDTAFKQRRKESMSLRYHTYLYLKSNIFQPWVTALRLALSSSGLGEVTVFCMSSFRNSRGKYFLVGIPIQFSTTCICTSYMILHCRLLLLLLLEKY